MKPSIRAKLKMRYAPRYRGNIATYRKDATYFENQCCSDCYWDWGHCWERRQLYKHEFTYSNYCGILKKYWVSSCINYAEDYDG